MGVTGASGWVAVETKRLLERRYPRFVHARDPKSLENGYLPFFTFHTMEPFTLEAKLRYLAENDYSTLTLERALAHLRGERRAPPRSVVLTIDDGRLSTWSVAGPLLRRYGMTATAFVIPGYLEKVPPVPLSRTGSPPVDSRLRSMNHEIGGPCSGGRKYGSSTRRARCMLSRIPCCTAG